MLNVHKPRVYKSVQGCCICRAKSSSSRFTDSKRYEQYFKACFHILERRDSSEICNACVLLTKRFKQLPPESTKNWRHVVDVRETNSSRTATRGTNNSDSKSKKSGKFSKHRYRNSFHRDSSPSGLPLASSDRELSPAPYALSDRESSPSALPLGSSASPVPPIIPPETTSFDCNDVEGDIGIAGSVPTGVATVVSTGVTTAAPTSVSEGVSSFIDPLVWRQRRVCCGLLFLGPFGAAMVDQRHWKPCSNHRSKNYDSKAPQPNQDDDNPAGESPENSLPSSASMSPVET